MPKVQPEEPTAEKRTPADVRGLRFAADVLSDRANLERSEQIRERGPEAYLADVLGPAGELPAKSCFLVWSNKTEQIIDIIDKTLLEYLCWRAKKGPGLPEAVLTPEGDKLYL